MDGEGSSQVANLATQTECTICYTLMTVPCQLSCGHSYCKECLNQMVAAQQNTAAAQLNNPLNIWQRPLYDRPFGRSKTIKCPQCRVPTNIPDGGLPTNFMLQQIIETLTTKKPQPPAKCKLCDGEVKRSGFFDCNTCGEEGHGMCSLCAVQKHNGHALIERKSLTQADVDKMKSLVSENTCKSIQLTEDVKNDVIQPVDDLFNRLTASLDIAVKEFEKYGNLDGVPLPTITEEMLKERVEMSEKLAEKFKKVHEIALMNAREMKNKIEGALREIKEEFKIAVQDTAELEDIAERGQVEPVQPVQPVDPAEAAWNAAPAMLDYHPFHPNEELQRIMNPELDRMPELQPPPFVLQPVHARIIPMTDRQRNMLATMDRQRRRARQQENNANAPVPAPAPAPAPPLAQPLAPAPAVVQVQVPPVPRNNRHEYRDLMAAYGRVFDIDDNMERRRRYPEVIGPFLPGPALQDFLNLERRRFAAARERAPQRPETAPANAAPRQARAAPTAPEAPAAPPLPPRNAPQVAEEPARENPGGNPALERGDQPPSKRTRQLTSRGDINTMRSVFDVKHEPMDVEEGQGTSRS